MTERPPEHAEAMSALRRIVADPAYGAAALSDPRLMSELLGGRLSNSAVIVLAARPWSPRC
jgi:hypothetical protein